jgi:hypothetical protein
VFTSFEDPDGNVLSIMGFDHATRLIEEHRRRIAEKLESERRVAWELEIARQVQARLFPQKMPHARTLEYAGAFSTRPILEDNVKSSEPWAVAGVLCSILIAGCVQTREANAPSPPATSYQVGSFELQDSGSSQKVRGASVTPVFFQSAKMPTLLGRGFLPEEYGSGSPQVVMVSHRLWQLRFRGDPRITGTTMRLNGQAFTVIGIMPPTFDVPSGVDIWMPKAG